MLSRSISCLWITLYIRLGCFLGGGDAQNAKEGKLVKFAGLWADILGDTGPSAASLLFIFADVVVFWVIFDCFKGWVVARLRRARCVQGWQRCSLLRTRSCCLNVGIRSLPSLRLPTYHTERGKRGRRCSESEPWTRTPCGKVIGPEPRLLTARLRVPPVRRRHACF